MADAIDNELAQEFATAFAEDEATDAPAVDPKSQEAPTAAPEAPVKEDPAKDAPTPPETPEVVEEAPVVPVDDKKPEDAAIAPVQEAPPIQPLTREDLTSIIQNIRSEERNSGQAVENATKDVIEAYYPNGLSNIVTDVGGRQLKTPQDVVDASNGEMSTEQATQWLMNEQYTLDQNVAKIKDDAKNIAETTVKFKQDGIDVLQRYDPLFKAYPQVQEKVWNQYSRLIKTDEAKGVILSAPDMREFYDTMLEPYRLAYEYGLKQPATNPTDAAPTPPAPTPSAVDRMDEGGDAGVSAVDDPNDFAQQVNKELAKGM